MKVLVDELNLYECAANARVVFAKREVLSREELIRAVPDVTIESNIKLRLKLFRIAQPNRAVYSVRSNNRSQSLLSDSMS